MKTAFFQTLGVVLFRTRYEDVISCIVYQKYAESTYMIMTNNGGSVGVISPNKSSIRSFVRSLVGLRPSSRELCVCLWLERQLCNYCDFPLQLGYDGQ